MANAWIIRPLPIVAAGASDVAVGSPINVANDYAGIVWRSSVQPSVRFDIDLGSDQQLDTVALFGIQGPDAGAIWSVALATQAQGQFTGASWSDNLSQPLYAGAAMPVSGKGVALWLAPAGAPAAARYLRFFFDGPSDYAIEVARIVVGKRIVLSRNFGYGASFGVRDLGSLDFSPRGVMLRRRAAKLRTVALTFSNIRKDEVEAVTKPLLEQIGNTETIALITDPASDAQRQNRAYFGPLVGDLAHTWRNSAAFEAKANIVSLF